MMLPHRQPSVSSEYKDRYDRLIPKDHSLRKLFDLVDISCIYDELVEVTIGHESPYPLCHGRGNRIRGEAAPNHFTASIKSFRFLTKTVCSLTSSR